MLIKQMLTNRKKRIFSSTGEDMDLATILTTRKIETYQLFFHSYDIIFIFNRLDVHNDLEALLADL
ncbi:hypothetical protein [Gracilinema caldarium]|uniref:Uncharacterized protein n=1 Tax=Gracilinema caldarium (strain ATCC 51460 / DSM 7334 / H1) TaxID=744872 RepID=F8EWW6_GRAC1|nr:hypothetical protein [Gracilinema caldarium]AEJ18352.1 hypothetical protein Spica_0184 [Gracilinema caldarium DSM 7334]